MNKSDSIATLAAALAKAQAQIGPVKRNAKNPFFKSTYADLSACWDACRKPFTDNGLSIMQLNIPHDAGIVVQTMILHESGEWISDEGIHIPASKIDAQGFGSAITYGRRYGLCSMTSLAPTDDDDDAERGTGHDAVGDIPNTPITGRQTAVDQFNRYDIDEQNAMQAVSADVKILLRKGQDLDAAAHIEDQGYDSDHGVALWSLFSGEEQRILKKALATVRRARTKEKPRDVPQPAGA